LNRTSKTIFATLAILIGLVPLCIIPTSLAAGANLIANFSLESISTSDSSAPENWLKGGWGSNTPVYSYLSSGHTGGRSVRVDLTSHENGDVKWYFNPINVSGGGLYSFSDYYQSSVSTDIVVQYSDNSGNFSYSYLGSAVATSTWQQYAVDFTVPANITKLTVFHLINKIGYLATDDYSLTTAVQSPTVAITSPSVGASVSGTVLLEAQVSSAPSVNNVQFQIDGQVIGVPVSLSPYQFSWDSAQVSDGSHILVAVATLADGSLINSLSTSIRVSNGVVGGDNLISNESILIPSSSSNDLPLNWQKGNWGTNNAIFSYITSGYDDNRSLQTQITGYISGDAKWYFDPVAVQAGAQYTFSDYYKSSVSTDVIVRYSDTGGNFSYQYLGSAAISSAWQQFRVTFTVPSDVTALTVFHVINNIGTLTTDSFSLIKDSNQPPTTNNMIPNPSVVTVNPGNASVPLNWHKEGWGANQANFSYLNTGYDDSRSLRVQISSITSGDAKWFFEPQPVQQDVQYVYSEHYKSTVQTEIDAVFTMADGSTIYHIIGLPDAAQDWTEFHANVIVPLGAQKVTIYHLIRNVGSLSTDNFSLSPAVLTGLNRALVSISFDDNYKSVYTYGLPLLEKYGFVSTQYIVTNWVGLSGNMSKSDIQMLYSGGHEIASHTLDHPNLSQENVSQITSELYESLTALTRWTGAAPTGVAYPYGLYNNGVIDVTRKYYEYGRGVESGLNSRDNVNPYDIRVQNITSSSTTAQIADWVYQALQTRTWLVLVYHSVNPDSSSSINPSQYNVTPAQLNDHLSAIQASGIAVVTVSQAFTEVNSQL
jgi:peptidoglycan/xylan/chitin deacetylase (PgdA/CDA1 family)